MDSKLALVLLWHLSKYVRKTNAQSPDEMAQLITSQNIEAMAIELGKDLPNLKTIRTYLRQIEHSLSLPRKNKIPARLKELYDDYLKQLKKAIQSKRR